MKDENKKKVDKAFDELGEIREQLKQIYGSLADVLVYDETLSGDEKWDLKDLMNAVAQSSAMINSRVKCRDLGFI